MNDWKIRATQTSDTAAIRALTAEGYPGVSLFEPNELEWAIAHAARFLIAASPERIVAYLIAFASDSEYDGEEFRWFQQNAEGFLYIDRIAVAGDMRRSGLGKALYAHLEQFARKQNFRQLVCEVNLKPPNPVSLAFHTNQGFKRLTTLETRDARRVALLY